jgi:hypothetical protein
VFGVLGSATRLESVMTDKLRLVFLFGGGGD